MAEPSEHRRLIDQVILHPPPLMTLFEEMHQPREDESIFEELLQNLLSWKAHRDDFEKKLRQNFKMLWELAEEQEKEKAKQQVDMMELEKKLMEYQKENQELLDLGDNRELNMIGLESKLVAQQKLLKLAEDREFYIIELEKKLLGQHNEYQNLLALSEDIEKESVELHLGLYQLENKLLEQQNQDLEVAEDREKENCKLQLDMIELKKKFVEQLKLNNKLLELTDNHEKENYNQKLHMIKLEKELVEQKKENKKLLKSAEDCEKESGKMQSDIIELEKKLMEQQKENKKLMELAEDHEVLQKVLELEKKFVEQQKENTKLLESAEDCESYMIEMEKNYLALQIAMKDKDEVQIANDKMQELTKDVIEENISPQLVIGVKRRRDMDSAACGEAVKRHGVLDTLAADNLVRPLLTYVRRNKHN